MGVFGVLVILVILIIWILCKRYYDSPVEKLLNEENDVFEDIDEYITRKNRGIAGRDEKISIKPILKTYEKYDEIIRERNFGEMDPNFVVDRAEGFRDNMKNWYGVDLIRLPVVPEVREEQLLARIEATFNIPATHVPVVKTITKTRAQHIPDLSTKAGRTEHFMKISQKHTNDKQNVHDSGVNKDMRETYAKIKNSTSKYSIEDIKKYVEKNITGAKKQKVLDVVARMNADGHVSSVGDSEKNILLNVWNRAYDSRNSANRDNIMESVVDNLNDCWENGTIICTGGRCSRIISSLVLLDYDDNIGKVQTTEQYKNEVFSEANRAFQEEINTATQSDDKMLSDYGKSFNDPSIDDSTVLESMKEDLHKRVEIKVDAIIEKNKDHIPPEMKTEVMAGFTF